MTHICQLCMSPNTRPLVPPGPVSMVSDGSVLEQPLAKQHCNRCGSITTMNDVVVETYHRSTGLSAWEMARHNAVARGLFDVFRTLKGWPGAHILEIGAGNFATSGALYALKDGLDLTAIEPSPEHSSRPDGVVCVDSELADYKTDRRFDILFSNQVIEHVADPLAFLKEHQRLLARDGHIVICCPTQSVVSNELMFADHLFHYTVAGFRALLQRTQALRLVSAFIAPWDPLTHVYCLKQGNEPSALPVTAPDTWLFEERQHLLSSWAPKEDAILRSLAPGEGVQLFGAGELSQIIEVYMPRLFARVEALIVTNLDGARQFDRPIMVLEDALASQSKMLLGIRPDRHDAVREKLVERGVSRERIIDFY